MLQSVVYSADCPLLIVNFRTATRNASSLLSVNLDHHEQCEFTHSLTTASADICLGNELQALFELFQSLEREKINIWVITISTQFLVLKEVLSFEWCFWVLIFVDLVALAIRGPICLNTGKEHGLVIKNFFFFYCN